MRTLIIFAKAPSEGKVKTRLAHAAGRAAALRLYGAMVADVAAIVKGGFTGKTIWYFEGDLTALENVAGPIADARHQFGDDLGHRMREAFENAFAETADPVAIIGTDCPGLSPENLTSLFEAVEMGADTALIPANDGGYAALALKRMTRAPFEGVRWSHPDTLADTINRIGEAGLTHTILPPLVDLDDEADLRTIASSGAHGPNLGAVLADYGWSRGEMATVVDDLGRVVAAAPSPSRIVSLVPSVTEALFDLGAGDRVAGRTEYCISPRPWVDAIPSVGGPKTFNPGEVIALKPDLVLADAEENDRERVEALIAAGVRVFVALPRTLPDISAFLRRVGRLAGIEAEAEKAASLVDAFTPEAALATALCLIWNNPLMAAGPGTLAGNLARAAGFECPAAGGCEIGYPVISETELAEIAVDILLLPSEPYPFSPDESVTLLSKANAQRAFLFPGEWITWYGARTISNIKNLSSLVRRGEGLGIFDFRRN